MKEAVTVETTLIQISPTEPEPAIVEEAAAILRRGGLVAFPTETVYGLGADALHPQAVQRIFVAKGRPAHDPLIVHIADIEQLSQVARTIPPLAWVLGRHFWPGALTLVLPKATQIPSVVTAGGQTVAVRCPSHPLALALIRAAKVPIAAPSANRFSHTSPTTAHHVLDDLAGRVEMILDGGPTPIGVESTVLDLSGGEPLILRPGGVTAEALCAVVGPVQLHSATIEDPVTTSLASPGLLSRHYAPHTPLWLFTQTEAPTTPDNRALSGLSEMKEQEMRNAMRECASAEQRKGGVVALLLADEDMPHFAAPEFHAVSVGSLQNLEQVAARLFSALRTIDGANTTLLLARDFPAQGLGLAIRDRLRRAADRIVSI